MREVIKNFRKISNFYEIFKLDKEIYLIKNFLVFFITFCLSICLIVFGLLAYYKVNIEINDTVNDLDNPIINPDDWINLNKMPDNIRIYRTLFDLFLVIYLFFLCYGFKKTYNYFNVDKILSLLYALSFFPLFSLMGAFYMGRYCSKNKFYYELWTIFGVDLDAKKEYSFKEWKRKLILLEWIIFLPTFVWIFYPTEGSNPYGVKWVDEFLFNTVCYFTIQSNLICLIFLTLFLFFPHWKAFNSNSFQIACTTYIAIVGSIWLFALLPSFIINENVKHWSSYDLVSTIWLHIINPISFVIVSLLLISKTKKTQNELEKTSVAYVAIYPLFYTLFTSILPFNAGFSVYGWITNLNSNLAIFPNIHLDHLKYNFGEWYYIFAFIGINIIVVVVSYLLFYYSYMVNLKAKNNNTITAKNDQEIIL